VSGIQLYPKSILTLEGIGCQRYAPAALPRGRDPAPIAQEVRLVSGQVWMGPENLVPDEIGARTDKTVNIFMKKMLLLVILVKINLVPLCPKMGTNAQYVVTNGQNYILQFIVTEMCLRNTNGLQHVVCFPPVCIIQHFWAWSFKRKGKMKDCYDKTYSKAENFPTERMMFRVLFKKKKELSVQNHSSEIAAQINAQHSCVLCASVALF
jgi:hypothetical protein